MAQDLDNVIDGKFGLPCSIRAAAIRGLILSLVLTASACVKPEPRRFEEFMDDSIARDGTLARCNQDRSGTAHDIECANARRAAAAIALAQEQERRAELERESERKLASLRSEIERRDRAKRDAMAAALAAAEAAYEAQWADELSETQDGAPPSFGSAANPEPVPPPALEPPVAQQFGAPIGTPVTNTGQRTAPLNEGSVPPSIPRPFQ